MADLHSLTPLTPDLGIGVGLRPAHYDHFLAGPPSSVSWVEVISENYLGGKSMTPGRPLQLLEKIRNHVPVVLHGVSMSLGSDAPLDGSYLRALRALIQRIEPAWISDHLSWTGPAGSNLHDLLPLPCTEGALALVTAKICQAQDFLGRRMLIENPSTYFEFSRSEMPEWKFLAEITRRADCGILLDVNNVYVSAVNHGYDPLAYLDALPAGRVGQIHLAGHTDKGNILIDTHDSPVCEAVWALYEQAVRRFPGVPAMVERDANIPDWQELEAELKRAAGIRAGGTPRQTFSPMAEARAL